VPVRFPNLLPNFAPREDTWPTDPAVVTRRLDNAVELAVLCSGFPLAKPKRRPVINFRSEDRKLPKGRRLVPASHFFEFTGSKSPKQKWRFTKTDEYWFCFSGLWRPMPDDGEAFTLLTTEPGPDVAPIQPPKGRFATARKPESELVRALSAGGLTVEQVRS